MVTERKKFTTKLWRERNQEYLKEYNRANHAKRYLNPENRLKASKRSCAWAKENKDRLNQTRRRYGQRPKGIYQTLKCNAKKRGIPVNILAIDFIEWYENQDKKCYYCGVKEDELFRIIPLLKGRLKQIKRLTIDRMENNKGYEKENMCLACSLCNTIKTNIFSSEEMLLIGTLILRTKLYSNTP